MGCRVAIRLIFSTLATSGKLALVDGSICEPLVFLLLR